MSWFVNKPRDRLPAAGRPHLTPDAAELAILRDGASLATAVRRGRYATAG